MMNFEQKKKAFQDCHVTVLTEKLFHVCVSENIVIEIGNSLFKKLLNKCVAGSL